MMKRINFYYVMMLAIFASATAIDYCNLKSCTERGLVHTMCRYRSPTPASTCQGWFADSLSVAEKNAIVKKHNELRQKVASGKETRGKNGPQPAAVYMPDLTWDDEIATIAQRWANQCAPGHDSCRNVERFRVGQNMAMTMSSGENGSTQEELIQMWYDEVDLFDRNQVSKLTNINRVGHYTQIVSAVTTKVGCGRIKYKQNNWTTHYLICNYGPAGNILYEKLYEIKA